MQKVNEALLFFFPQIRTIAARNPKETKSSGEDQAQ